LDNKQFLPQQSKITSKSHILQSAQTRGCFKVEESEERALLTCLLKPWAFSFEEEFPIIPRLTGIVRLRFLCIREAFLWLALYVER
jgi:hypothetical protein